MQAWRGVVTVLSLSVAAAACGDDGPPAPTYEEESAPMFDPTHVLEIAIDVAPADWDTIRAEHYDLFGRLIDDCPGALPADPYSVVSATVTIDGEVFDDVGLRKKGFLGSASEVRPSLKLSFDEYEDREVHGLERMTLNNNQQDLSYLDTCLAYQVFREAGVAAPRCTWAHVTVNGEDLGVYANVESIRRRFLGTHFADTTGNLYEGQVADLRAGWVDNYEDKNGNSGDRSDLQLLVTAAASPDGSLVDALDPVLDLDEFMTFWATEVLVGHWDGYAGDRNNHYLYRDPSTAKFAFLPWGPDSAFGDPNPFLPGAPPESAWANSILTRRLYALPATRAQYQARLRALLDTVWDEDALNAEIDRVAAMIGPFVTVPRAAFDDAIAAVHDFVDGRRTRLEADLAIDPDWPFPLPDGYCASSRGAITGSFDAPFTAFPPSNVFAGAGTLEMTIDGTPLVFQAVVGAAGPDDNVAHPHVVGAAYGFVDGGDIYIPVLQVEPERWTEGTHPVDGYEVFGVLIVTNAAGTRNDFLGFVRGTLDLTGATTVEGEHATGTFALELVGFTE